MGYTESKQGGGRLKRDRSDDADDDDAMAVEEEEEGQPAKKAKEAEQQRQEGGAGVDEGAEVSGEGGEALIYTPGWLPTSLAHRHPRPNHVRGQCQACTD